MLCILLLEYKNDKWFEAICQDQEQDQKLIIVLLYILF